MIPAAPWMPKMVIVAGSSGMRAIVFEGVFGQYREAQAAAVVQGLLKHVGAKMPWGALETPGFDANRIVAAAWDLRPDLFDGRHGLRPTKIGVAAAALAHAVVTLPQHVQVYGPAGAALTVLLTEIERKGDFMDLNSADANLIQQAFEAFHRHIEAVEQSSEDEARSAQAVSGCTGGASHWRARAPDLATGPRTSVIAGHPSKQ